MKQCERRAGDLVSEVWCKHGLFTLPFTCELTCPAALHGLTIKVKIFFFYSVNKGFFRVEYPTLPFPAPKQAYWHL